MGEGGEGGEGGDVMPVPIIILAPSHQAMAPFIHTSHRGRINSVDLGRRSTHKAQRSLDSQVGWEAGRRGGREAWQVAGVYSHPAPKARMPHHQSSFSHTTHPRLLLVLLIPAARIRNDGLVQLKLWIKDYLCSLET